MRLNLTTPEAFLRDAVDFQLVQRLVRVVTEVTAWMKQNLPGGFSAVVPPDPMPNSEVKRRSADGSVGSPHARVGNCQALIK